MGERSKCSLVFKFQTIDNIPESAKLIGRGLDFGFQMIAQLWLKYSLRETYVLQRVIIQNRNDESGYRKRAKAFGVDLRDEIWCDSAEPKSIEEIFRMGFNAKKTAKGEHQYRNRYDQAIQIACYNR